MSYKRNMSNYSGEWKSEIVDPDNAYYDSISSGDEIKMYRRSDDLLLYGGYVETVNRKKDNKYIMNITGGDYTTKLNNKIVNAETYENRELSVMVRDMMHNYICSSVMVDNCDIITGWAAANDFSGLARDTTNERIGDACLQVDCTYSTGNGTLTKTITDGKNLSNSDWIVCYLFVPNISNVGSSITLNFGQDSSNYYTVTRPKSALSTGWNYVIFEVSNKATGAGSPSLANVDWYQVKIDIASGTSAVNFRLDEVRVVSNDAAEYTVSGVQTTAIIQNKIVIKNISVFKAVQDIANVRENTYNFFVDENKDLRWGQFGSADSEARLSRGQNIFRDEFFDDDTRLTNAIWFYGGRSEYGWRDDKSGTAGTDYVLTYSPVAINLVTINGEKMVGYKSGQTSGVYDYDVDFESKTVEFQRAVPVTSSIAIEYNYSVPIIVYAEDTASIVAYGRREKKIENKEITNKVDASSITQDYIQKYKAPITNGTVECPLESGIAIDIGETVQVTDSRFFSGVQTLTCHSMEHKLIDRLPRSVIYLTGLTKKVEEYLAELYNRINAIEEEQKGTSEITSRLVPIAEDLAVSESTKKLTVKQRTSGAQGWPFFIPPLFSTPIMLSGGGSGPWTVVTLSLSD